MIRSIALLFCIPLIAAQSSESDVCSSVLTKVAECFVNSNTTTSLPNSDASSCKGCFTNHNFFDNYDQSKATCNSANSDICEYLNKCHDDCFPTTEVCQEEYDNYFTCVFGVDYAPDGCLVQCNGTTTDSSASKNDISNGGSSTTYHSAKVISWIVTSALLLLAVAILGNGLLLVGVAIRRNASIGSLAYEDQGIPKTV